MHQPRLDQARSAIRTPLQVPFQTTAGPIISQALQVS